MRPRPDSSSTAVELFAEYLAREPVETGGLENLCAEHPEHAGALRALYREWLGLREVLPYPPQGTAQNPDYGVALDPRLLDAPSGTPEPGNPAPSRRLDELRIGRRRYSVQSEVARGGMGAILKVWDRDLRRHLAMKVILSRPGLDEDRSTPVANPRQIARFLEEAQVTGQLEHPGVPPVHDVGIDDEGRLYFTMPLVEGRSLQDVFELARTGTDGWNRTRTLNSILSVCDTVAYAHSKGVIHRDLKPSNVMVGRFGEVYVMDWGVSKVVGRDDPHDLRIELRSTGPVRTDRSECEDTPDSPLHTVDGRAVGTPAYMSPEQAQGRIAEIGAASDVYSVGAMLYELLAGRMPYVEPGSAVSPVQLLACVRDRPPRPVQAIAPESPPELVAICAKSMSRDPRQRYPGLGEMALDLRAFLEGRVVRAHRTGAFAELRKWTWRNRVVAAVGLVGVFAMAVGLVWALFERDRAEQRAQEAAASSGLAERRWREAEEARAKEQEERRRGQLLADHLEEMVLAPLPDRDGRGVLVQDVLVRAAEGLDWANRDDPAVRAFLMGLFGRAMQGLSLSSEARPLLFRAWELNRELHGDGAPETARALASYAENLGALGDGEAEELFVEALQRLDVAPGPDHEWTLAARNAWLAFLIQRDRFHEAEEEVHAHLQSCRETLGGAHVDTVLAATMVGAVHVALGRFEEAIRLLEPVRDEHLERHGESHSRTAPLFRTLGDAYHGLRRAEDSAAAYAQALKIDREVLGDADPGTWTDLADLGVGLWRLGRIAEAESLLQAAWSGFVARSGEQSLEALRVRRNLGNVLLAQLRSAEAEELFQEIRPGLEAHLGANSRTVLLLGNDLGLAALDQGRNEEAARYFAGTVEGLRGQYAADDPTFLVLVNNTAHAHLRARQLDEALPWLEEVQSHLDAIPANSTEYGVFQRDWGRYLQLCEDFQDAERLLLEAWNVLETALPADNLHSRLTAQWLVELYETLEEEEEAARFRR